MQLFPSTSGCRLQPPRLAAASTDPRSLIFHVLFCPHIVPASIGTIEKLDDVPGVHAERLDKHVRNDRIADSALL